LFYKLTIQERELVYGFGSSPTKKNECERRERRKFEKKVKKMKMLARD